MKKIDLNETVYTLTEKYPELIEILKELDFLGVVNPVIRKTVGRKTTIPEGSKKQGKNLEDVIKKLEDNGFKIIDKNQV